MNPTLPNSRIELAKEVRDTVHTQLQEIRAHARDLSELYRKLQHDYAILERLHDQITRRTDLIGTILSEFVHREQNTREE